MKKILILNVVALVALIGLGAFAYFKYWNVASVNGVNISRLDYIKTLEKQGGQQVLASMIDEALILKEGANKGVVVDQKTIDEELSKIEGQLKAQNETLDSALKAAGMSKADLEKQIRIKKIETALSASKVEVTQAQIDEFLTANKSLLPTNKSKEELQALAKEQLTLQASQSAADTWLNNLRSSAKIIYR